MRKRWLLLGAAVLTGLAVAVLWYARENHLTARINFDAGWDIQPGMTAEEVEALLGGPPGDYGSGDVSTAGATLPAATFLAPPGDARQTWIGQYKAIRVWFDDAGRVKEVACGPVWREKQPVILYRLRAWLGW